MVSKIREKINGNSSILRPILVFVITGVLAWMAVSVKDFPTNFVSKVELKEVRKDIQTNRHIEILALEKLMNSGFNSIKETQQIQGEKIDEIIKFHMRSETRNNRIDRDSRTNYNR